MAWLSGWAKRAKLTIDHDDVDAALTWFPVRVHLGNAVGKNSADVSFIFDELESDDNRKKIAVTKDDGETQLYVEIERWDDANEEAELWISRDGWGIAPDVDTDIYIYYDKTHADNDAYVGDTNSTPAENVWDANFKAVYHMRDDPDNEHVRDSTGNNNDGTKKAANEPAEADGKIGKAQDFDGEDDFINCGNDSSLDFDASDFLIEALVKPDAEVNAESIFSKWESGVGGYTLARVSRRFLCILLDSQHYLYSDANVITAATWVSVAYRKVSNTKFECFVDGVLNTTPPFGDLLADIGSTANNFLIDKGRYATEFAGLQCEIRISKGTGRNAAWIKATKESLWDDLVAFGGEELVSCTIKVASEAIGIGEAIFRVFPATLTDKIYIVDRAVRRARFIRIISEVVGIVESQIRRSGFVKLLAEVIAISDSLLGIARIKTWLRVQVSRMAINRLKSSRTPLYRWITRRWL